MSIRGTLVAVSVPNEHGGWGLTLEPVVLGLLAAPSGAGWLVGGAALVGFLARTPVRVVLVDRHRDRRLDRTDVARRVLLVEAGVLLGLVVLATLWSSPGIWWPAALAAPLVLIGLWYDRKSRSRRLLPELFGAIGIGSAGAVIGVAGGLEAMPAVGLWLVIIARSIASIPFVRVQVRRIKSQEASRWHSDAAQAVGCAIAGIGIALDVVSVAAGMVIGALAVTQAAAIRLRPPPVGILGAQQVALGLAVVLVAGLAAAAP